MTDQQRELYELICAKVLYDEAGKALSTKSETNRRAHADAQLRELYETTGARTLDIRGPDGKKLGTLSAVVQDAQPEAIEETAFVADVDNFMAWLTEDDGRDFLRSYVLEHAPELAAAAYEWTGDYLPDGVAVQTLPVPAQPVRVKSTTLRITEAARAELVESFREVGVPLLGGDAS